MIETANQLAVERGVIATRVITALKATEFTFVQNADEKSVGFVVSHPSTTEWKALIRIEESSSEPPRNILGIPDVGKTSTSPAGVDRLMGHLTKLWETDSAYMKTEQRSRDLIHQQDRELKNFNLPQWLDVHIVDVKEGTAYYRVTIEPGSPFERMTVDKLRIFLQCMEDM